MNAIPVILTVLLLLTGTGHLAAAPPDPAGKKAEEKIPPEEARFYELGKLGKNAFNAGKLDEARKHAKELETLTPKFKGNWNYGNAIQDSNIVLGRIALKEGDVDAAKKHLLAAGASPGSPQMDSFGPNMSLAKDLLKKGEKEVVLQYFKLCRKFWKMGHANLDRWSKEVEEGKVPSFGANLIY